MAGSRAYVMDEDNNNNHNHMNDERVCHSRSHSHSPSKMSDMERRKQELLKSQELRKKETKKNKAALKKMNGFQKFAANIGVGSVGSSSNSKHVKQKRRKSIQAWEDQMAPPSPPAHGSSMLTASTYHGASRGGTGMSDILSKANNNAASSNLSGSLHGAIRKNLNTSLHGIGNSLHGRAFKDMKGEVSELKSMVGAFTKENSQLEQDGNRLKEENEYLATEMENMKQQHKCLADKNHRFENQLQVSETKLYETQLLLRKLLQQTSHFQTDDEDMNTLRGLAEKVLS